MIQGLSEYTWSNKYTVYFVDRLFIQILHGSQLSIHHLQFHFELLVSAGKSIIVPAAGWQLQTIEDHLGDSSVLFPRPALLSS